MGTLIDIKTGKPLPRVVYVKKISFKDYESLRAKGIKVVLK